jgi:hypothetical protein
MRHEGRSFQSYTLKYMMYLKIHRAATFAFCNLSIFVNLHVYTNLWMTLYTAITLTIVSILSVRNTHNSECEWSILTMSVYGKAACG